MTMALPPGLPPLMARACELAQAERQVAAYRVEHVHDLHYRGGRPGPAQRLRAGAGVLQGLTAGDEGRRA